MITLIVNIELKDSQDIETFVKLTYEVFSKSNMEDGCIDYDILQNEKDLKKFTFIEIFSNQQAIDFHGTTEHFKIWKSETWDMIESKEVIRYINAF